MVTFSAIKKYLLVETEEGCEKFLSEPAKIENIYEQRLALEVLIDQRAPTAVLPLSFRLENADLAAFLHTHFMALSLILNVSN